MKKHLFSATINTQVIIDRPCDQVWQHFQSVSSHQHWNHFLHFDRFPTQVDEQISVTLNHHQHTFKMTPQVTQFSEGLLAWKGKLFIHGLFNGYHQFKCQAIDKNSTLFTQSEYFSGLLVPLFYRQVIQPTQAHFEQMNHAFKHYLESHH